MRCYENEMTGNTGSVYSIKKCNSYLQKMDRTLVYSISITASGKVVSLQEESP